MTSWQGSNRGALNAGIDFRPAKGGILIDVFIGEFRNNFQSISHQILPLRQYILNQSVYLDFERFSLLKIFPCV